MVDEPASTRNRDDGSSDPPETPSTEDQVGWVPVTFFGFLLAFGLCVGTLGLTRLPFLREDVRQPIDFSHRLHVEDVGLDCQTCHELYATEISSGLPSADTCAFCHVEAQGESPEEQRLVALLAEGEPLQWKSMFRQPAHIFYSHRRHVTVAGLECETCHGDFARTETPPSRVEPLAMEDCIGCHESEGVATDCTACHR